MPTVMRIGPYRLFFYASDRDELPHVHVERDDKVAKFWLDPVRLQKSGGFSCSEISKIHKIIEENSIELKRVGMSISVIEMVLPYAVNVLVTEDTLSVELSDGRTISVPIEWYPRLVYATMKERNNWRLIGRGEGIHWEDLDEDISIEGLLAGRPSAESQASFKRWLAKRKAYKIKAKN